MVISVSSLTVRLSRSPIFDINQLSEYFDAYLHKRYSLIQIKTAIIYFFLAFSTHLGIREGTVASAMLIGLFVRQFKKPAERVVKRVTRAV